MAHPIAIDSATKTSVSAGVAVKVSKSPIPIYATSRFAYSSANHCKVLSQSV